jgi:hypothetical protein
LELSNVVRPPFAAAVAPAAALELELDVLSVLLELAFAFMVAAASADDVVEELASALALALVASAAALALVASAAALVFDAAVSALVFDASAAALALVASAPTLAFVASAAAPAACLLLVIYIYIHRQDTYTCCLCRSCSHGLNIGSLCELATQNANIRLMSAYRRYSGGCSDSYFRSLSFPQGWNESFC